MKKNILFSTIISLLFTACGNDDDGITPEPVNEQELITTLKLTFTPEGGGDNVVFIYRDMDGTGPGAPEVIIGKLAANTNYNELTLVLNENKPEDFDDPEYNITQEISRTESTEHQFFYSNDAGITFTYADIDTDTNPLGITNKVKTGDAGTGKLTVTLRHQPNKTASGVQNGDITNAGGETDIEVTFDVVVE